MIKAIAKAIAYLIIYLALAFLGGVVATIAIQGWGKP